MRIYIFADMEGISGISGSEHVTMDGRLYQQGRKLYTMDMNACAEACFEAGAEGVVIRDGHSCGRHALIEELDPRVELVQGDSGSKRLPGVEECDAVILLGYHAMAGASDALLEHTFSSKAIQNLWLNGRVVGEVGIDAAIAADYGKPVIMVSGDDKVCREAEEWLPGVVTCQVKTGLSCQGARLLSLPEAHSLLAQKTKDAISRISEINLMKVQKPVTIRKELCERGTIRSGEHMTVIDSRTGEVTADSAEEAFFKLW